MQTQHAKILWLALLLIVCSNSWAGTMKYYAVHTDQLGTPQVITNENKQVVWEADRDPFGKVTNIITNNFAMNVALPGQYSDAETNYNQNWNRDYDPSTGRYLEPDRLDILGRTNDPDLLLAQSIGVLRLPKGLINNQSYVYAGGNPILYVDLYGLDAPTWVGPTGDALMEVGGTALTLGLAISTKPGGFAIGGYMIAGGLVCTAAGGGLELWDGYDPLAMGDPNSPINKAKATVQDANKSQNKINQQLDDLNRQLDRQN